MPTDSSYPPLEKPEFQSQIPEHLLVGASDAEKHIISQLSIIKQFSEWSSHAHLTHDQQVRKTNGRLIRAEVAIAKLEEDKKFLKSGWKVLVVIGGVISGFASFIALIWQTLGGK
jgi:hypothetical protein